MVAPLFTKNTLAQTGFAVTDEGFSYNGRSYTFSEVAETRSYRVIHQTRYIPMGETASHNPAFSFVLIMRDGEKVQVTEQSTLLSSSKQDRVELLQESFDLICQQTFQQRARRYVDQIESNGYFNYGLWRFSPVNRKIIDTSSGRAFNVSDMQFLRGYGFIELVPRNESFMAKTLRKSRQELSGKRYGINTLVDSDVFFSLLGHYFQLKW